MRKIIIGDVHGCADEFRQLLQEVHFQKGVDQLYMVGDLINRGPKSKEAYQLLKEYGGISVLGNHELHLIHDSQGVDTQKRWVQGFKEMWGEGFEEYIADLKTWPLFVEEEEFFLVHAGISPEIHPKDTDPRILTRIRTWDGLGEDLHNEEHPAWFDLYKGEKPIIFGHWAALEGVIQSNVIGLDTGCVYGKKLTAVIFPSRKLVSVKSAKAYCPIK